MISKAPDARWMRVALAQADKAIGQTAENPPVGCVILSASGHLVGVGHTAAGGRPHAETQALQMAGDAAQGGVAYVSLEPCAHHGQTPPCAQALITSGVKVVHIAISDPDARVAGRGRAQLEEAGIHVTTGCCAAEATHQMAGFLRRVTADMPFVALKMATSKDGFIAADAQAQTWLTGEVSRRYVHDLRSRHDVILTGMGTIRADNPRLDIRLPGWQGPQPALALLSTNGLLPEHLACFAVERPIFLFHDEGLTPDRLPQHVTAVPTPLHNGRLSIRAVLSDLAMRGYGRVMVEAGAQIADSALSARVVDELHWLCAPHHLTHGVLAWQSQDSVDFSAPADYIMQERYDLAPDSLSIWRPNAPATKA